MPVITDTTPPPSLADLKRAYYGGGVEAEYDFLLDAAAAGVSASDAIAQVQYDAAVAAMRPTGAIAETISRYHSPVTNLSILTSGSIFWSAIPLYAGQVCTTATFSSGATLATAPTNQWFALANSAAGVLRFTNNDTTTAWAALATKTLTFTTPYTVPTSGVYYLGIMVAAGTPPSLNGMAYGTAPVGITPRPCFTGTTGQTTVPALPFTSAVTASVNKCWAWIS